MVQGRGAKYANGNYKNQQKAYNNTEHGRKLITDAVAADRDSKKKGIGKKNDNKDNGHVTIKSGPNKGKRKTVLVKQSTNRAGLGIHKRRKPRRTR